MQGCDAGTPRAMPRAWALVALWLIECVRGGLLLDEDFSCRAIGCNATHGITNYSYWRWSTTGSTQVSMGIYNATGRPGNEVDFTVRWCQPPNPNPDKRGCYRSELALQRDVQSTLIDWSVGVGSSERWFGFSNRLLNFSFDDTTPLNGPSFQIHAGNGTYTGKHPVLNLQVDSTGCALSNRSCPRWTLGVSAGGQPNPACSELYDACWSLGAAAKSGSFDGWNDWVIQWRGSPDPARGHVGVWRNGEVVLPLTTLATAYNDTVGPYPKFGVYRGSWKEMTPVAPTAKTSSIAYGALRVGDAHSSFDEVSTAVKGTESPQ